MMKSVCCAVLLLVTMVNGGQVCTENSQCQAGECCQIMSEFMVVSKRDLKLSTDLPHILTKPVRTGTCEAYKPEGARCGTFDKMNGYCSCEPGTSCKGMQVPVPTNPTTKRMMPRRIIAPKPGYTWEFTCTRE